MEDLLKEQENHRRMGEHILQTMQELGLEVSQSHTFHYFFYADEAHAIELCTRLREDGYHCEIDRGDSGEDHLCFVEERCEFAVGSFNRKGLFFLEVAREHDAIFDGWEIAGPDNRSEQEIFSALSRAHFIAGKYSA